MAPTVALKESKGRSHSNEMGVYCRKGKGELGQAQPSHGSTGTGKEHGPFQCFSTKFPPALGPALQLPLTHPERGDVGLPSPLPHPSPKVSQCIKAPGSHPFLHKALTQEVQGFCTGRLQSSPYTSDM